MSRARPPYPFRGFAAPVSPSSRASYSTRSRLYQLCIQLVSLSLFKLFVHSLWPSQIESKSCFSPSQCQLECSRSHGKWEMGPRFLTHGMGWEMPRFPMGSLGWEMDRTSFPWVHVLYTLMPALGPPPFPVSLASSIASR